MKGIFFTFFTHFINLLFGFGFTVFFLYLDLNYISTELALVDFFFNLIIITRRIERKEGVEKLLYFVFTIFFLQHFRTRV